MSEDIFDRRDPVSFAKGRRGLDQLAVAGWVSGELHGDALDDVGWSELYDPSEVVAFAAWRKRLPDWGKGFADAWYGRINQFRAKGVSSRSIWRLEAAMRRDVRSTVEDLADAPHSVRESWLSWYGSYVEAELAAMVAADPSLERTAEEQARHRKDVYRAKDRAKRAAAMDDRLLAFVIDRGNSVEWSPAAIAHKLMPRVPKAKAVAYVKASVERLRALGLLKLSGEWRRGQQRRLLALGVNKWARVAGVEKGHMQKKTF